MGLYLKHNNNQFQVGDTIKVRQSIVEGNKKRAQSFEGLVVRIKGDKTEKMFTVRKISDGVGVERIWPIDCPSIENIKVLKKGKVKRAVLNYIKSRTGRLALKVKTDYTEIKNNASKTSKTTSAKKTKSISTTGTKRRSPSQKTSDK